MDEALRSVNGRLKAAKHRCSIVLRGNRLSLVATLPERDNLAQRKQQRISLGLDATLGGLEQAERRAIELSFQLREGTFTWDAWTAPPEAETTLPTLADFRSAAERLHATKYRSDPARGAAAWSKKWQPALRKLPENGVVTEALLLRTIRAMPAGTASRRDQGNLLAQVAKSMGFDTAALLDACRGYGVDKLTERDIPTDAAIEAAWRTIRLPHWRWAFGICAAFGLRPHECAELVWLPEDWIEIGDATKTGSRRVRACPGSWVTRFSLHDLTRPTQSPQHLAKAFNDALDRDGVTIRPYTLRHAYALRLMSRGITPDLGARLMGHSLQVHQQTYQRWIEADRIQRALDGVNL